MGATLAAARDDVHAEQAAPGRSHGDATARRAPYRGASDRLVDGVLDRARATLREES